ncbi:MAG TPA: hypothetical protein VHW65_09645, partial [Gemmatimonadales bacterium]|nr:hypothetical protein [Gemmatimonadales bacterium]
MAQRAFRFLLAVGILATAALFMARGQWPWTRLSDVPTSAPILVSSSFRLVRDTLQQGETVGELLRREGVTGLDLASIARTLRFDPRLFKAGLVFSVRHDPGTNAPTHVDFRPNGDQRFSLIRAASGAWTGAMQAVHWVTDTIRCADDIQTTLSDAIDHTSCDPRLDRGERIKLTY